MTDIGISLAHNFSPSDKLTEYYLSAFVSVFGSDRDYLSVQFV